ncbi:DUF1611 domain-containing protein [Cyanobium gracile]|uniref:DUF1611 domain-containing protein n=1 Tax=Cyanobium gracile UHCC 0281 TaxID=3110309 RepID=A0ABU5SYP8_9CYAN|nr:DUF1611 domain-containing protein [Cyanobium gracile]MEA5443648.1 DUF1611 domain-containing protein [Cyanobium gracile UHCC 0281]
MLGPDVPIVLLQHGGLDNLSGKTGLAMLRYRQGPIVAVVDPANPGADLGQLTGIDRAVPVVGSLAEALPFAPEVAVVGLAPSGGRLPEGMGADVAAALAAGLSLASGLHSRLGDDPALAALVQPGRWIWDLRREPPDLAVASGRAAGLPGRRLLGVGTDMSVGKMSACLELQAAARRRGRDARFVGTGQAGILISGAGVALDAVRIDYAAGAVEGAVLAAAAGAGPDTLVLIEGQGSLCHPGSSATLPLIRGSQPTDLVLVHRAGQRTVQRLDAFPLPPLGQLIAAVEALAALGRPVGCGPPPRVAAIALNTALLDGSAAAEALEATAAATGLPCADPVRQGGEALLDQLPGQKRSPTPKRRA